MIKKSDAWDLIQFKLELVLEYKSNLQFKRYNLYILRNIL